MSGHLNLFTFYFYIFARNIGTRMQMALYTRTARLLGRIRYERPIINRKSYILKY